jgi:hypothetical protein
MVKISFVEFKKLFDPIYTYNEEYKRNATGLELICSSSFPVPDLGSKLLDSYISLLETYLQLDHINDDIGYFVFECELGEKAKKIVITDQESGVKKEYLMDTLEHFYDYLCS